MSTVDHRDEGAFAARGDGPATALMPSVAVSLARFPHMIKHLRIENFRCLRKVELDLEPLTVLVGPNGSGKSSVLGAIAATTQGVRFNDIWNRDRSLAVVIEAQTSTGAVGGKYLPLETGLGHPGSICRSQHLQLDLQRLRATSLVERAELLKPDGTDFANTFASLGRALQNKIVHQFASLVPMFGDVNVKPIGGGQHGFFFADRWNASVEYEPQSVSDGTMLVLAYLTVLHQTNAPDLLAIEEPERGLHPYLIGELITLLRKLTTGELGVKPIQVLLATHSAELLNFVEPKEVRFFSRSKEDGGVMIESAPVGTSGWAKAFATYDGSLGGLWLSGNLGGVPGT